MQNIVVLMEPYEETYDISQKGGNMCLNRFCVYEDAAFELCGVFYLEKSSNNIKYGTEFEVERKFKGTECLS